MELLAVILAVVLTVAAFAGEITSEDAIVSWDETKLELETSAVIRELSLANGSLQRTCWLSRATGVDLLQGQSMADFTLNINGQDVSSASGDWNISEPSCETGKNKELLVSIKLARPEVTVIRHFIVYPGLSLMREWLEIVNSGTSDVQITEPPIISVNANSTTPDLKWMTGAEQFGDSWKMRTHDLSAEPKAFDSYDAPIPVANMAVAGDGTEGWILLNGKQVWPTEGNAISMHGGHVQAHDFTLEVQVGDKIQFVLDRREQMTCDTTQWDPVVTYVNGTAFKASEGYSTHQGENNWTYAYLGDDGQRRELTYADAPGAYGNRWRLDTAVIEPFISAMDMHPDPNGAAMREFNAPQAGTVTVQGAFRNIGNQGPAGKGFRMGSMCYAPWLCLYDRETENAAYLGFDCMAHWKAKTQFTDNKTASAQVILAGYSRKLKPGEQIRTPYAFTGLFKSDMDDMGQEMLHWQYRFLWDYTREPWFPGIRMLGYWMKGTHWGSHGWVGGDGDMESAYRKIFRTADFMRQVGGDTYHRDWGWWDKAGDWNGPDFRSSGEYLRKYDMGQLIYAFIYTVDSDSSVAKAHPNWLADGATLDQSMPEVVDYEVDLLDSFYRRWGAYQWRNDSTPISPRGGNDTYLLHQQQGFMEVLKRFQDDHPDCAFQGVNGGGMAINWEYLGYSSGFQFTDGQSMMHANYDASYLFPTDKINNMPDIWDPAKYDPATWRGLLCSNFDLTGDTFDEVKLEGLRDLIDVYHYLQSRGVVGRWVRVYHPIITGDDETMYLQRSSWDQERSIIITKHKIVGSVNIRPKGLVPTLPYHVSFHESKDEFTQTGAELMNSGITLDNPAPGELIYFNLPDHPGNRIDVTPPSIPANIKCQVARNMDVPGVEITWDPAQDDHWLSYYSVWRDGVLLGKVAKGCFFFDHSAGADPAAVYEIRAVDGSGNASLPGQAKSANTLHLSVLDDADMTGVQYFGEWQYQTNFTPAYLRTLSCAASRNAAFEVKFTGRSVTWHSRLGAEGGLAVIILDGKVVETVSCYAADEIPQWPIFEYNWETSGEHTLRVEVCGQRDERNAGTNVWLDGISIKH